MSYLEGLNLKQLQQLCMMFSISTGGTKQKIIEKLHKKQVTKSKIDTVVDKTKKYFVRCDGVGICENCVLADGSIARCGDCMENQNAHVYFTDIVMSNHNIVNGHYKMGDNKTNCLQCGKISYMEQHNNAFFVA